MITQASTQDSQSPWQSTPGFPQTHGPSMNYESPWQSTPGFPSIEGPPRGSQSQGQSGGGGQFDFPPIDDQIGDTEELRSQLSEECNEIGIKNVSASGFESDPSDYHPPTDAIDGDSSTWWSNNGKDPWLQLDLGEPSSICSISIEWNKGDKRDYSFEIQVSEDGNSFEKVFEGKNDKGLTEKESYQFDEPANGQYIKLTITGTSSKDGWTSIQEISALGKPNFQFLD